MVQIDPQVFEGKQPPFSLSLVRSENSPESSFFVTSISGPSLRVPVGLTSSEIQGSLHGDLPRVYTRVIKSLPLLSLLRTTAAHVADASPDDVFLSFEVVFSEYFVGVPWNRGAYVFIAIRPSFLFSLLDKQGVCLPDPLTAFFCSQPYHSGRVPLPVRRKHNLPFFLLRKCVDFSRASAFSPSPAFWLVIQLFLHSLVGGLYPFMTPFCDRCRACLDLRTIIFLWL